MKKPSSEKKLQANRQNALKSTGPRTDRGKNKSRSNALKHGSYSTRRLLEGEDAALYDALRGEQIAIFAPKSFVDQALVDQLVGDLWTLRRVARAENLLYRKKSQEVQADFITDLPSMHDVKVANAMGEGKLMAERLAQQDAAVKRSLKNWPSPVFEHLFFEEESQAPFERLAAFKRQLVNNILALERELKRRLEQ